MKTIDRVTKRPRQVSPHAGQTFWVANLLILSGSGILVALAASLAIACLMLHLGMPVSLAALWVGCSSAIAFLAWSCAVLSEGYRQKRLFFAALAMGVLIGFCGLGVAAQFLDLSGDGNWYHQEAVHQLAAGWNPYSQPPIVRPQGDGGLAVECFSKGIWINETLLYLLAGDIEAAKGIHIILALAAQALVWGLAVRLGIRAWLGGLIALVAVWNAVVIVQMCSYYLDGDVSSSLVAFLAAAVLCLVVDGLAMPVVAASALMLLASAKLTGIFYGGFFLAGLAGMGLFFRPWKAIARKAAIVSIGLIAGITLEATPWQNWVKFQHPFYPLMGPNAKFEQMTLAAPRNLRDRNRFVQLGYSIVGQPELSFQQDGEVQIKPWFQVSEKTLQAFRHWPDPNIAGYGIFMPETLLFTLLTVLLIVPKRTRAFGLLMLSCLLILLSVLLKPRVWYARYNPQLTLLPVIPVLFVFVMELRRPFGRLSREMASMTLLLLLLNSAIIAHDYLKGQRDLTVGAKEAIANLENAAKWNDVTVNFFRLRAHRFLLERDHVRYQEIPDVTKLPCETPILIPSMHLRYCVSPKTGDAAHR